MSGWTKAQLEDQLSAVVDELELSDEELAKHGPLGTPVAELVREVLAEKNRIIRNLRAGMVDVAHVGETVKPVMVSLRTGRRMPLPKPSPHIMDAVIEGLDDEPSSEPSGSHFGPD